MAAFHVSDPDTDRLVRTLAARRSLGITEAINLAVRNELAKDDPTEPDTVMPASGAAEDDLLDELDRIRAQLVKKLDQKLRADTLAYTRLLAKHQGKRGVGSRVYQMIARHGPVETLRRLVAQPTDGLAFLRSIDRLDLAAEQIALDSRFQVIIPEEIRAAARRNLGGTHRLKSEI